MKKINFGILIIILSVIGCAPASYYQMYKTQSNNLSENDNRLIFENDEIKLIYNFWSENGNGSFFVYNKTNEIMYLDMQKSHFIVNGLANPYFQNREYSQTQATSTAISKMNTKGSSNTQTVKSNPYLYYGYGQYNSNSISNVSSTSTSSSISNSNTFSYSESRFIFLPANSGKIIKGYNLNSIIYMDCDYKKYPKEDEINSIQFDTLNTPFSYRNIIYYGKTEDDTENYKSIENKFWVSQITNYHYNDFIERKYITICGKKSTNTSSFYLLNSPSSFFIKYKYSY